MIFLMHTENESSEGLSIATIIIKNLGETIPLQCLFRHTYNSVQSPPPSPKKFSRLGTSMALGMGGGGGR